MGDPPLRILWVDPDLAPGRPSRMGLRRRGASVLLATSAERACELAELFPFDLFVLSDRMGVAEPGDLASHVRSAFPGAEIILLSQTPKDATQDAGLGLLYSGTGPLSPETITALVNVAFPGRLESRAPARSSPATVLCVDDDPEMLRSLSRLLSSHGYRPRTLRSAEGVMEAIPGIAPDLAILDVLMPGIDGHQLAHRIRDQYRDRIPLVMLSARASDADVDAGFRNGASAYLSKPCPPERLLDVVDYFVGDLDALERGALESDPGVWRGRRARIAHDGTG